MHRTLACLLLTTVALAGCGLAETSAVGATGAASEAEQAKQAKATEQRVQQQLDAAARADDARRAEEEKQAQ
jgi:hypothetical protein